MKRLLTPSTVTALLLCSVAAAEDYDFFGRARYPGPIKAPGVDLYQVEQAGGPFAEGYQRRVVSWWPRKGVDIIEVQNGMPLRTWTLRDRKMDPTACAVGPELGVEELTRRLTPARARRLEAHLIGFRGIGNRYGDPFGFLPFYCPAVVLRLEDGANYACDREEKEVLEDWFRYKDDWGIRWQFYVLNLNGHLHGQPEFVVDGDRRGFRFDGRTQYAEASPILADLGEITVDVALKWEGGANQVVFDFGTSTNNRFVLIPAGVSGKPELAITREGQTDRVVADAALPKDKWAECRVEIDGERIALWIDGRKAAERRSAFRPADVYPAGVEKRNFIAASRDGTGKLRGVLDYLRVYHTVYDDFTKAPVPRRHAPRRVTREFIDSCRKEYGGAELRDALIEAKMRPVYAYYGEIGRKRDHRIKEIEEGSPAVAEARRKLGEVSKKLDHRRSELRAEYDKLPETIKKLAERRKLEDQARELEVRRNEAVKALEAKYMTENKALVEAEDKARAAADEKRKQAESELQRLEESFKAMPEIAQLPDETRRAIRLAELKLTNEEYLRWRNARDHAGVEAHKIARTRDERFRSLVEGNAAIAGLEREIRTCRARAGMLRTDPRAYADKQTAELRRQVVEAEMEVGDALKKSTAEHKPEYDWLCTLRWLAFSGHYNYPYRSYLRERISKDVGGKVCHEDFGTLESIYTLQTTAKWHTRCDWEWRLSRELDGSIEELPLLRKWLESARGDVRE